ncbi:MAG: putative sugar nucleotidyl transferase [Patescibacteria group bacterium]|jgi:UDP-N-acetylglucosamine diphosphorylase/glucosamine-1-phosphate N-acetyltransferase
MPQHALCLFEDDQVHGLEPLHFFHASWDLLCGTGTLAELLPKAYDADSILFSARKELTPLYAETPYQLTNELPAGSYLFINGRVMDPWSLADMIPRDGGKMLYYSGNTLVAARLEVKETISEDLYMFLTSQRGNIPTQDVTVPLAAHLWDYMKENGNRVTRDAAKQPRNNSGIVHATAVQENPSQIFIEKGSIIGPLVVLDATEGPIIIESGARIGAQSVLLGPVYIGQDVIVNPHSLIRKTSIGRTCKVGGEIAETIMMPFSNKQHDGHLGDAYIGSWVNLGAGTTNSNLKNTYSTVNVEIHGKKIDTGLQFAGCFLGDHVKTGIGTLLPTGTVIGPLTSIFGGGSVPKTLPALRWFDVHTGKNTPYDMEKALVTIEHTMARRSQTLTDGIRSYIRTFGTSEGTKK